MIFASNIQELKEFLIDRNGKGERPMLIIGTPYTRPETGKIDDVYFMPKDPKYNQFILDMLKKDEVIPEDSTINDYSYLLISEGNK